VRSSMLAHSGESGQLSQRDLLLRQEWHDRRDPR
jgi:hypothetical protein